MMRVRGGGDVSAATGGSGLGPRRNMLAGVRFSWTAPRHDDNLPGAGQLAVVVAPAWHGVCITV